MLYLKEPNLIFVKSRKTAGTSVEIALSMSAQTGDIVTRLALPDELLRQKLGGPFPFGWAEEEAQEYEYIAYIRELVETGQTDISNQQLPPKYKKGRRFFNHMAPTDIVARIGLDAFEDAYTISMCRDPYEKLVSQAWFRAGNTGASFADMLEHFLTKPDVTNQPLYFLGDEMVIDHVIRYEHLHADLAELEVQTGLSILEYLPNAKSGYRKEQRPAREVLSEDQKRRCFEMCRWEFEYFGYESGF
jgi:hypothetical protein